MNRLSNQTKRDILSFLLTLSIYLILIILWHHYTSVLSAPPAQTTANEITLDLSEFVQETLAPEVPEIEKEIEPAKEEEAVEEEQEEPEPVPEPVIKPEPKELVVEKPRPSIVKTPVAKKIKKKPARKKSKKKKKATVAHHKQSVSSSRRSRQATHSNSTGNRQFVARLKAKINANKVYPRIARKRGMQGQVKVYFRITSIGKISNLSATGSRIFIKSAKSAVKNAFPLSTRGALLPMNVTLTLKYHLKS